MLNAMMMEELCNECATEAPSGSVDEAAALKSAFSASLPFRFELLARSLICAGGYTVADIVKKESAALIANLSAALNVNERQAEDELKSELRAQMQHIFGENLALSGGGSSSNSSAAYNVRFLTRTKLLFSRSVEPSSSRYAGGARDVLRVA